MCFPVIVKLTSHYVGEKEIERKLAFTCKHYCQFNSAVRGGRVERRLTDLTPTPTDLFVAGRPKAIRNITGSALLAVGTEFFFYFFLFLFFIFLLFLYIHSIFIKLKEVHAPSDKFPHCRFRPVCHFFSSHIRYS